jgi:hypothetical protein
MFDEGDTDSPHPLLTCAHTCDGQEPREEMAVILKDWIEDPEGMQSVVATGRHCRACPHLLAGERLGNMEEAWVWLEEERAKARP